MSNRANSKTAAESPTPTQPAVAGSPRVGSSKFPAAAIGRECRPILALESKMVLSLTETPGTFPVGPFCMIWTRYSPGGVGAPARDGGHCEDASRRVQGDGLPRQVDLDPLFKQAELGWHQRRSC
jgi:hypothetical protein